MEITIDLRVLGTLLRDNAKSIGIFEDELGKVFEEGTSFILRQVIHGTPVFRGHLSGSSFREVTGSGLALHGLVATPSAYAGWIESGEPPHVPNFGNLAEWVRAKMGISGRHMYAVTTVISRKMAAMGTTGRFPYKIAFETGKIEVQKMVEKAGARVVARLNS